jgi:hypothetical protein
VARFRANSSFVIGAVKYKCGTVFADAPGSLQPGDILWLGLDKTKMSPALVPLDDGAQAIMGASRFAGVPPWPADGAGSVS